MNDVAGLYVKEQIEVVDFDAETGVEVNRYLSPPTWIKNGEEVTDPEVIKILEEKSAASQPSS